MTEKSLCNHVKYYVVLIRSAKYHALMLTKPLLDALSGSMAQLRGQFSTPTTMQDLLNLPTKSSQFASGNNKVKQTEQCWKTYICVILHLQSEL
jgi:hypothetical protein